MQIAAVQFKARADFEESLEALCRWVREAGQRARVVVCPEMAVRGYSVSSHSEALAIAEAPSGPTSKALGAVARDTGAWVVCGFPERDGHRVYNAAVILNPQGEVAGVHRKMTLFEADLAWATPGPADFQVYDTGKERFTVGICADINSDVFLQWCALEQVDAIALPTNWIQEEGEVWDYWRARLFSGWPEGFPELDYVPNRQRVEALLVAANSYGREGDYDISGLSAIMDCWGIRRALRPTGDGIIVL